MTMVIGLPARPPDWPSATHPREPGAPHHPSPGGSMEAPPPPDLTIGAFSDHAPWVVNLDEIEWSAGIDGLRYRTSLEAPNWVRRRRLPPSGRVLAVGFHLGTALGTWYLGERRRGDSAS